MNPALLLAAFIGVTLLLNAAFFWLNPAQPQVARSQLDTETWQLHNLPQAVDIDADKLLAAGRWGPLPAREQTAQGEGESQQQALTEEEALRLRSRLRGVTRQGTSWRVILETAGELQSLAAGDKLPGTPWRLLLVQPDRLLLEDGKTARELRLFQPGHGTQPPPAAQQPEEERGEEENKGQDEAQE